LSLRDRLFKAWPVSLIIKKRDDLRARYRTYQSNGDGKGKLLSAAITE
jgi:hypothetical protein